MEANGEMWVVYSDVVGLDVNPVISSHASERSGDAQIVIRDLTRWVPLRDCTAEKTSKGGDEVLEACLDMMAGCGGRALVGQRWGS
jgi:hypothetical protein